MYGYYWEKLHVDHFWELKGKEEGELTDDEGKLKVGQFTCGPLYQC